jgi:hypothetical protein
VVPDFETEAPRYQVCVLQASDEFVAGLVLIGFAINIVINEQ